MAAVIQKIYTDGACSGNPGPGGWGVVIHFADGTVHELGGADPHTTSNRMEMQAAIAALEFLQTNQQQEPVVLYTDSDYLRNGITSWLAGWKKKGWKTSQGKPVLNQDLWQQLDKLNTALVTWRYVKAHVGQVDNERCDTIARAFSHGKPIQLRSVSPSPIPAKHTDSSLPSSRQTLDSSTNPSPQSLLPEPTLYSPSVPNSPISAIMDSPISTSTETLDDLPREVRVGQLRNLIDTLRIADEVAREGYLITSSELADLMDINASAVTSRGDHWVWRNWVVSRVRREGNQILWQLERVDG